MASIQLCQCLLFQNILFFLIVLCLRKYINFLPKMQFCNISHGIVVSSNDKDEHLTKLECIKDYVMLIC